jgi:hypothetical protein
MIYIPVQGGLGNQLFQWSMAHYITQETDFPVTLVQNHLDGASLRTTPLLQLSKQCKHGVELKHNRKVIFGYKAVDKLSRQNSAQIAKVFEKIKMFTLLDHESAKIPEATSKHSSIRGFFQSPSMVKQVWDEVRSEIQSIMETSFDDFEKDVDRKFFEANQKYQAVHIRRGDYIENKDILGVLSLEYFEKLINPSQIAVVCSDTLKSAELDHWSLDFRLYNQELLSAIETLAVLSNANKLVMSNSTLSWWASQFVLDRGGEVVAPLPWFKGADLISAEYLHDKRFSYAKSDFCK